MTTKTITIDYGRCLQLEIEVTGASHDLDDRMHAAAKKAFIALAKAHMVTQVTGHLQAGAEASEAGFKFEASSSFQAHKGDALKAWQAFKNICLGTDSEGASPAPSRSASPASHPQIEEMPSDGEEGEDEGDPASPVPSRPISPTPEAPAQELPSDDETDLASPLPSPRRASRSGRVSPVVDAPVEAVDLESDVGTALPLPAREVALQPSSPVHAGILARLKKANSVPLTRYEHLKQRYYQPILSWMPWTPTLEDCIKKAAGRDKAHLEKLQEDYKAYLKSVEEQNRSRTNKFYIYSFRESLTEAMLTYEQSEAYRK